MAKLHELASSGRYDLLVLDTPPTANALDFLDAPERVAQAIDSPAIQWFVKPSPNGKFSLKSLGLGATFVVGRLARFVGAEFLDDVAEFVVEFNSILGGFRQRAEEVFALLRKPEVAFVMVSSAEPLSVDEASYFYRRLVESRMPLGAFVVNRVHPRGGPPMGRAELIERLAARPELTGFGSDDIVQFAADLERTAKEAATLGAQDALQIERLGKSPAARRWYRCPSSTATCTTWPACRRWWWRCWPENVRHLSSVGKCRLWTSDQRKIDFRVAESIDALRWS